MTDISHLTLGGEDYVALTRPLSPTEGMAIGAGPVALILRSRTEQLRFLQTIHTGLAVTAVLAVIMATLLSFAVARTITRPLAAITVVMREVAATGDLTRKIAIREGNRWDDEDAKLLAATFNTLTDSISRFQREISQKERLSALGRLSTVIAHEVRNPLMIIKASLHALAQADLSAAGLREATADIEEEVARLNRIVNEVLDFARPIRFDLAPVDLNALCRDSALASEKSAAGAPVGLSLDSALPLVTTDAERLRIALVNLLVNARHAVNGARAGQAPSGTAQPLVTLRTERSGVCAAITIADRGIGIVAGDIPRVFDPYFTTRRGGTGLGLPIAKNIVEGLGGTIVVTSAPGRGTEIRIELSISGSPS
jgi:signal transduction histidine kinase